MNSTTILYVEDEEADVILLQHVLTKAGIPNPLQTVKDGKAAKDYLAGNPPFDDRRVRGAGVDSATVTAPAIAGGDLHLLQPAR